MDTLGRGRLVAVAMSLLLLLALAACRTELLTGLSQRQANEAIALLQRHDIEARKKELGKGRYKIEVDSADFPDAVGLLDRHGLPRRDDVSIADLFPTDSLVNSPAAERARLISGIEHRLEQTIQSIERVLSARVHISYPLSDRSHSGQAMHASVMVTYDGPQDDAILIQRLKQLLKNSFDALSFDNISIVVFQAREMQPTPLAHSQALWSAGGRWLPIVLSVVAASVVVGVVFWRRRRPANQVASR
ncbi:type III secretion system inner membrane ring lipoprotein SctJ [Ralstonia mojiangensis]|uniref:type III secretion system inner membrane ring lipoprotein SctJ n=1 Tax=Ralstonia mojiangensis TaxID=2953895 RepID=UPI002091C20C|nr:type III secretion inner membrane ring lipoprotein SctJ [Ralstonia mojiangensis]MCO5413466.1 type III secretion inner membrane ring lipoprotein SctJ [Ralstonia mojiangensis]